MATSQDASDSSRRAHEVELRGVRKAWGESAALNGVDLEVASGEFVSLLGPSGCGKTTTLNVIAGFVQPDEGEILLGGKRVASVPPHKRNIAMVFQSHALFPHMNVFDNIAFGLQVRHLAPKVIRDKVARALEVVRLPQAARRMPRELSGGQQQRVALARALVVEPRVLLLDEPFSNLDAKLRQAMQIEVREIHERLGLTSLYVTHDQNEALVMSDRIAVMNEGRVIQVGSPAELYQNPATEFVVRFLGDANVLPGTLSAGEPGTVSIKVGDGMALAASRNDGEMPPSGSVVRVAIREERVQLHRERPPGPNAFRSRIKRIVFQAALTRYFLDLGGYEIRCLRVSSESEDTFRVGEEVWVALPPGALRMLSS